MATNTPVISGFMNDLLNPGGFTTQTTYTTPALDQVYPVLDMMALLYFHTATQFGVDKVRVENYRGGIELFKTAFGRFGRPVPVKRGDSIPTEALPTSRRKVAIDEDFHGLGFEILDGDLMIAQFEALSAHAEQIGMAFAQWSDEEKAKAIVLSSRETLGNFATDDDQARQFHYGGNEHFDNNTRIADNAARTSANFGGGDGAAAEDWLKFLDNATVLFKTKEINVPSRRKRFLAVPPQDWDAIRSLDRVPVASTGGSGAGDPQARMATFALAKLGLAPSEGEFGDFDDRIFYKGVEILQTNNLPETDLSSDPFRTGDYTKTKGIFWTPDSTAWLQPMGFNLERDRVVEKTIDRTFGKAWIGSGSFRPMEAIEAVAP